MQELHGIAPKQMLTVTEPPQLVVQGPGSSQIRSWKGQQFEVQTSTDLQAWASREQVTNTAGTLAYTDPDPSGAGRRFYRVAVK